MTDRIGHFGLCLATFLAVKPLCVNTIIRLALTSNDAFTAQLDMESSVDQSEAQLDYGVDYLAVIRCVLSILC